MDKVGPDHRLALGVCLKKPERGCVVPDQPQHVEKSGALRPVRTLRLVCDPAALLKMRIAVSNLAPGFLRALNVIT